MVFDKGQEDFLRLFRYLSRPIVVVAKVELYKPSTSFGSGKIKPDPDFLDFVSSSVINCDV